MKLAHISASELKCSSNPSLEKIEKPFEFPNPHSRFQSLSHHTTGQERKLKRSHSLSLVNPPIPTSETVITDPEIKALFQSLQKSIEKLEKDMIERKKSMNVIKAGDLDKRFNELKRLLHNAYYQEIESGTSIGFGRKKAWWVKVWGYFK